MAERGDVIENSVTGQGQTCDFDAVENTVLLAILAGSNGRFRAVARARAKFALLSTGSTYAFLGLTSSA